MASPVLASPLPVAAQTTVTTSPKKVVVGKNAAKGHMIDLTKGTSTIQVHDISSPALTIGSPESQATSYVGSPASQVTSYFGPIDSPASTVENVPSPQSEHHGDTIESVSPSTVSQASPATTHKKKIVVRRVVKHKDESKTNSGETTTPTTAAAKSVNPTSTAPETHDAELATTKPVKKKIVVKRVVKHKVEGEAGDKVASILKSSPQGLAISHAEGPLPQAAAPSPPAPEIVQEKSPAPARPFVPHAATLPNPVRPHVPQTISTQSAPQLRTAAEIEATAAIYDRYEQWANTWLQECELEYRAKGAEPALVDLKAFLDRELPLMLTAEANVFQNDFRFRAWAVTSGTAGLLPFGKTFVGALAKHKIQNRVRQHFGVKVISKAAAKKAEIDLKESTKKTAAAKKADEKSTPERAESQGTPKTEKSKDTQTSKDGKKDSKEDKDEDSLGGQLKDFAKEGTSQIASAATHEVASEVMADVATSAGMDVATDVLGEIFFSFTEELVHLVPGIGQMISFGRGYSKTKQEMRKSIVHTRDLAIRQHKSSVLPDLLQHSSFSSKVQAATHPIQVYRVPQCVSCFLTGASTSPCKQCTTHHSSSAPSPEFKACPGRRHDRRIARDAKAAAADAKRRAEAASKNAKDGKTAKPTPPAIEAAPAMTHSRYWCSKTLLRKAGSRHAWDCIPCFLAHGKHKPDKCELQHVGTCEYCGGDGHHAGACGTRFFHATFRLQQLQSSQACLRAAIADGAFTVSRRREWVAVPRTRHDDRKTSHWTTIGGHVALVGPTFAKLDADVALPKKDFKTRAKALR